MSWPELPAEHLNWIFITRLLIFWYSPCIIRVKEGDSVNKYYVEIDADKFEKTGAVEIIDAPVSWEKLVDTTVGPPQEERFCLSKPDQLGNFVRIVGGVHGPVAEYLIRRKDARNQIIITNRELASTTGVALSTANVLLQRLRDADCVRCRTGALMLNPGISRYGNKQRAAFLTKLYDNFENRANK